MLGGERFVLLGCIRWSLATFFFNFLECYGAKFRDHKSAYHFGDAVDDTHTPVFKEWACGKALLYNLETCRGKHFCEAFVYIFCLYSVVPSSGEVVVKPVQRPFHYLVCDRSE